MPQPPPTIALVLGSGGARGLAHIGIIRWLEAHGHRIQCVAGASMGALVGGIYAAGQLNAYREWVCALRQADVWRFLDLAFHSSGLIKGDRIIETLREMVGDHTIETLPIAFTAVATDIDRQREVWFSEGPLFDAIRASIAVPTIFTPHRHQGLNLLDGGLLNPVPIAPTFGCRTDLTIAVNLNAAPKPLGAWTDATAEPTPDATADEESDLQSKITRFLDGIGADLGTKNDHEGADMVELITRSFETMQNAIAAIKMAAHAPDIVIDVPRDACGAHEFHRAQELIDMGWRLAERAMSEQH